MGLTKKTSKMLYIDLDRMSNVITDNLDDQSIDIETTKEYDDQDNVINKVVREIKNNKGRQVDALKYEQLIGMVNMVLNYQDEFDDTLGFERNLNKLPINIRIAFNTLLRYDILVGDEL